MSASLTTLEAKLQRKTVPMLKIALLKIAPARLHIAFSWLAQPRC